MSLINQHKQWTKLRLLKLIIVVLSCVVLGGLFVKKEPPNELSRGIWSLFLMIAIILTSVIIFVSINNASVLRKICGIIVIAFMMVVFLFFAPFVSRSILSCLYTAPAMTPERFIAFTGSIKFLKKHNEYQHFALYQTQGLNFVSVSADTYWELDKLQFGKKEFPPFAPEDIVEMKLLLARLSAANCLKIQRSNDMVLFYTATNDLIVQPGVLYSIYGSNPNEISIGIVAENKPFFQIYKNWYCSRHLILKQNRWAINSPMPKSLIDRSLKIRSLNLEEFDAN